MADGDERFSLATRAAFGGEALQEDSVWRRCVQAGSILVAGLALRAVLDPSLPALPPFITLFPAVAITGLVAGTRAGTAVCLLGLIAGDYF